MSEEHVPGCYNHEADPVLVPTEECQFCRGWRAGIAWEERMDESARKWAELKGYDKEDRTELDQALEGTLERMAAQAHISWSGWMKHLFKLSTHNADGTVTIPAHLVERWERQIATPYADLSESEKDSDRAEANQMEEIRSSDTPFPLKRASFEELAQAMARETGDSVEIARKVLSKEMNDRIMDAHDETLRKLGPE